MKKYTDLDKKRFPTNTVTQMRLALFLPVSQVRNRNGQVEWLYESVFGKVTLRHYRLTQEHRDIVDVILSQYKPSGIDSDKNWEFSFTLYDLQKSLGKKSTYNNKWIRKKLDELQGVQLIIEPSNSQYKRVVCSVLNDHCQHESETGQTGEPLYTVSFNRYYMALFEKDIHVHTEALTQQIISVDHSGTKGLIRFCLSHSKDIKWRLSKILDVIGLTEGMLPRESISRSKKKIIENKDILNQFGIELSSDKDPMVSYKKHPSVWFKNPLKDTENL